MLRKISDFLFMVIVSTALVLSSIVLIVFEYVAIVIILLFCFVMSLSDNVKDK
jgi:hypothetical protein